jgi:hypothetical protein
MKIMIFSFEELVILQEDSNNCHNHLIKIEHLIHLHSYNSNKINHIT